MISLLQGGHFKQVILTGQDYYRTCGIDSTINTAQVKRVSLKTELKWVLKGSGTHLVILSACELYLTLHHLGHI